MGERSNNGRNRKLSAPEAVQAVRESLPPLLGKPIESVLGVERSDENGWIVTVQVLELQRIPPTTDVLGAYIATLDEEGDLTGYRRRRRYTRNQVDED